jgi:cytoskeleton protein RodZ
MTDIGQTLRDARMREHVDITEIEFRTKIRAKYLRALENEEWSLLPGPTCVRSFLRTYAEALGLDGRALVDELKRREGAPSELEALPPVRSRSGRARSSQRPRALPRWAVALILLVAVIAALAVIGLLQGSSKPKRTPVATHHAHRKKAPKKHATTTPTKRASTPSRVSLRLLPSASVYVCLIGDGVVRRNETLTPATREPTFHAARFTLTLGNSQVALVIGGRTQTLPASSTPLGYVITPTAVRRVSSTSTLAACG